MVLRAVIGEEGPSGPPGPPGPANTLTIGTVTEGPANASITGTAPNQTLNLTLPPGPQGPQGDSFEPDAIGPFSGRSAYDGEAPGFSYLATDTGELFFRLDPTGWSAGVPFGEGPAGPPGPQGPIGNTGAAGAAATIAVGTTTTGAAGSSASVTNSGTSSAAVFDFTIPRGDTGATGATGPAGPTDWNLLTNKPAFLAEGATAAAARAAIGAGTGNSNLVIGTTSTTAKAGDYQPTIPSQATAEAGTNNTEYMTPLRTAQAITARTIGDAPSDGTTYGRRNGAWVAAGGGSFSVLAVLDSATLTLKDLSSAGALVENTFSQVNASDASSVGFSLVTNGTTVIGRPQSLAASTAINYTTDGRTWSTATFSVSGNWREFCWDGTNFLAFATGTTTVQRSTSGSTGWAAATALPGNPSASVGQQVGTGLPSSPGTALIISSTAGTAYLTTNSGTSWSSETLPVTTITQLFHMGGLFVARPASGVTYYTSATGTTGSWTTRSAPFAPYAAHLGATNDTWFAAGNLGATVQQTVDGINWTNTSHLVRAIPNAAATVVSPLPIRGQAVYFTGTGEVTGYINNNGKMTPHPFISSTNLMTYPVINWGNLTLWPRGSNGRVSLVDITAADAATGLYS